MIIIKHLKQRIFYGWVVVLGGCILNFLSAGIWYYGFSVFFKPMVLEFGWSRAATAGAISLARLEGGAEGAIIGWFIDRFGPRRLIIIGTIIAGIGFILLSRINSLAMFYLVFMGVLAVGFSMGFGPAASTAVANWFVLKRGKALSLFTLGAAIGGTVVVPILAWFIEIWGWRTTSVIIGISIWVIALPVATLMRHKPEQYGYLPDGMTEESYGAMSFGEESGGSIYPDNEFWAKEAILTTSFWLLVIANSCRGFVQTSVVIHQVAYLTDVGISSQNAAWALGLMTLMSVPGRLFFGWLGDIFEKRYLMVFLCVTQALGIYMLAHIKTITDVWLFIAVYGISYGGAIPVYFSMRADYFGRKAYATIGGLLALFVMTIAAAGPVVVGWIFDVFKSYYFAFLILAAINVVAAVVFAFAKPPVKAS